MNIYICEESLNGFLTAVFYSYYNREQVDMICACRDKVLLGDTCRIIEPSEPLAARVSAGIKTRVGKKGMDDVSRALCSGDGDKYQKVYAYLKVVFFEGKKAAEMYNNKCVKEFVDLVYKVNVEAHRLIGFIRFKETANGVYYGYYGSDHDLIEVVAPHFADRFHTQRFILHDLAHKKIFAFDGKNALFIDNAGDIALEFSEHEEIVSRLWREYQENVTIEGRKNLKQQSRFMPNRYRWFCG